MNPTQARSDAKPYVETPDYTAFARRVLKALGKRVADADLAMLPKIAELEQLVDELLGDTARQLHDEHGYSWTEIGDQLGVSRQAARQRFAR